MINDNTYRLNIPEGEVRELTSPNGLLWERAVSKVAARGESAYVTRNNGIKGLKAYGGSPVKHKAEKLWGRYVPAVASDTTKYPMVLNGFAIVDLGTLDWTYYSSTKCFVSSNIDDSLTDGSFYIDRYTRWKGAWSDIPDKSAKNHYNTQKDIAIRDDSFNGNATTFKTAMSGISLLYQLATSDNSVWKFVKDIGSNGAGTDFGYYNDATNEFVKVAGASGTVIQPIAYAESTGTQYVDTELTFKTPSDELDLDFEFVSFNSSYNRVFGTSIQYTGMHLNYESSASIFYTEIKSKPVSTTGLIAALNTKYKVKFNKNGKLIVNDVDYGAYEEAVAETSNSIYLFGYHGIDAYSSLKVYGSKFIRNGEIIRDYLPVRIGTSVELLDLVNWTFATRVGTFTAGADIPYTQLCPDIIKVNTGDLKYGQYGRNIFNTDKAEYGGMGYTVTKNGNTYTAVADSSTGNASRAMVVLPKEFFNPNTTYAVLVDGATPDHITIGKASATSSADFDHYGIIVGNRGTINITDISDSQVYVSFYVYFGIQPQGTTFSFRIMVSEGSTIPTEYEPYHFGLHTDGSHKLFVGSQGVVDLGSLSWSYNANLGCGKTFYATLYAKNANGQVICFCDGFTGVTANSAYGAQSGVDKVCWIEDGRSIRFHNDIYNGNTAEFKAAMSGKLLFYQRTTDSAYVAPQIRDIPMLFSTDSNLDVQSGVKTEAWGVKVLDGTENVYNGSSCWGIAKAYFPDIQMGGHDLFATHWAEGNYTSEEGAYCSIAGSSYFAFNKASIPDCTTSSQVKAWLASEYAAGHPVIVLYPLANPATEQVTIAPVTSARRTTYVADSDSELGKLNLELKFLGK